MFIFLNIRIWKNLDYYLYYFLLIVSVLFNVIVFSSMMLFYLRAFGVLSDTRSIALYGGPTLREIMDAFVFANRSTAHGISLQNPLETYQHLLTFCYIEDLKYHGLLANTFKYTILKKHNFVGCGADAILTDTINSFPYQYKMRQFNYLGLKDLTSLEERYKDTTDILQIGFLNYKNYVDTVNVMTSSDRSWWLTLQDYSFLDVPLTETQSDRFKHYLNQYLVQNNQVYYREIQVLYDKDPLNWKNMFNREFSELDLYNRVKTQELLRKELGFSNIVEVKARSLNPSEVE